MRSDSRRFARAGFALALLALLPAASLWRRFAFRTHPPQSPESAPVGQDPGPGVASRAQDFATAARWLDRRIPGSRNCLTLALAGGWLLRLVGEPCHIRVGVKIDDGAFHSHAWLVSSDVPVLGGPLGQGYREIWRSRGPASESRRES